MMVRIGLSGLRWFQSNYLVRAKLVQGTLEGSRTPFRCLFVGSPKIREYLFSRIYSHPPEILREWRLWMPGLRRKLRKNAQGIDLCVAMLSERYEAQFQELYRYRTREWVSQSLDLDRPWALVEAGFHKNPKETRRKIRKYGLGYRVSRDPGEFEQFFQRMYLPVMRKRHAKSAYIDSLEGMRRYFEQGFLLLVEEQGQAIAGGLCLIEGEQLVFRRVGVLDDEPAYRRKGAQSAVYHFVIQYARECGLKSVDLMKSRFFLNDGVYLTKREWGAAVHPDEESRAWIYLLVLQDSPAVVELFSANPMLVQAGQGLTGIVGWQGEIPISAESRGKLIKRYGAPGLDGLKLLTLNGAGKLAESALD